MVVETQNNKSARMVMPEKSLRDQQGDETSFPGDLFISEQRFMAVHPMVGIFQSGPNWQADPLPSNCRILNIVLMLQMNKNRVWCLLLL